MPNSIHNLDTKLFQNQTGAEVPVIAMDLYIPDTETADAFLDHVVQQFKNQRMCSPPTTAHLTITAQDFCDRWNRRSATDPILKHFMSIMVLADILHIQGRDLLDRASLIGPA